MAKLLAGTTKNAIQKELSAQLLNTAGASDPINFDDVDGIPNLPGVLVINRVDSSGTATPSKREYIEYSGTSGTTVLITTRNVDGSNSALTHAVGSIVEWIPDVVWADRIYNSLAAVIDVDNNTTINSTIVTLTGTQTLTNKALTSPASSNPTDIGTSTSPILQGSASAANFPQVKGLKDLSTVGATETVSWTNGDRQKMTLDENLTITFSNATAGQTITLLMLQDGSGTNTITFADTIVWADATTPTWGTTADKWNVAVITYTGAEYLGVGNTFE